MPFLNLSEGIRGRESLTTGKPSIGLSRGIMSGRPRILAPSIRPFGSTQDRRWISKKARASRASAFSYERYALCSLGVQRLLRYPGPTPEASTGYPASLSSLDSCPQKGGGRNAWNGGRIALEWVAGIGWNQWPNWPGKRIKRFAPYAMLFVGLRKSASICG